jgi:hypothetical protein
LIGAGFKVIERPPQIFGSLVNGKKHRYSRTTATFEAATSRRISR